MDKMRISVISYLNSIPFLYGLEKSPFFSNEIELSLNIPSICSDRLLNNEVDIALVPIVTLNKLDNLSIIEPYCISADGPVQTVCLFSDVPLDQIDNILLDFHSRTSVELVKLLCHKYWGINVKFMLTQSGFERFISEKTAGLVIGDRAYQYRDKYKYVYDLSEEWKRFTELPFVFACWVTNQKLSTNFRLNFIKSLRFGLQNLDQSIKEKGANYDSDINKKNYLNEVISYDLNSEKRKSIERFLKEID